MFQISTRVVRTGLLMALGVASVVHAQEKPAEEPAETQQVRIDRALQDVEGNRATFFSRKSSTFGEIPGAKEFAAAQTDLMKLYSTKGPDEWKPSAAEKDLLKRTYSYWTPHVSPRFGKSRWHQPMGVVGADYREMKGRSELIVNAIDDAGPAANKLALGDIVLGANGRLLEKEDPRLTLGYALAASQTKAFGGKLVLHVVRDGEYMNIALALPILPDYSSTFPDDCPRADHIGQSAVDYFTKTSGPGCLWNDLFLLASGEPEAIAQAQKNLYATKGGRGSCWQLSHALIPLCEYYSMSGDESVVEAIQQTIAPLKEWQYEFGTWTHGRQGGYGAVNQVGLSCFMGLALAHDAGIEMDPITLERSIAFFARFVGGAVPYGNHGVARATDSDNGTSSKAALAFDVLGAKGLADRFARIACYMYMAREVGHAEIIFNMIEGPLGAGIAPAPEYQMFMRNLIWQYELGRRGDGSLEYLASRRFGTRGATAGLGLAFLRTRKAIRLTGAPTSVFGKEVPADLKKVMAAYKEKNWDEVRENLKAYLADDKNPNIAFAKELQGKLHWTDAHAAYLLKKVKASIATTNGRQAVATLDIYERFVGKQTAESEALRITALATDTVTAKTPATPRRKKEPDPNTLYDWSPILPSIAASKDVYSYKLLPEDAESSGPLPLKAGRSWTKTDKVVSIKDETVLVMRTFKYEGQALDRIRVLTKNRGDIDLNGYRLTESPNGAGNKKELTPYPLDAKAIGLLEKGSNTIVARLSGGTNVDIALEFGVSKKEAK